MIHYGRKISEPEDRAIKTIQRETERRLKKKWTEHQWAMC